MKKCIRQGIGFIKNGIKVLIEFMANAVYCPCSFLLPKSDKWSLISSKQAFTTKYQLN